MCHLATIGAVMVVAAFLTACGTSSSPTGSVGATASSLAETGESCRAQFEAWRHGAAKTAAEKLIAKFNALKNDADAADIPRTDAALKKPGELSPLSRRTRFPTALTRTDIGRQS
jgi:membrane-bound lytic murein transglycosylase B